MQVCTVLQHTELTGRVRLLNRWLQTPANCSLIYKGIYVHPIRMDMSVQMYLYFQNFSSYWSYVFLRKLFLRFFSFEF
jgi:hypothetical protein